MTVAELVQLVLKTSIVAMVFALGLTVVPADLACVVRRPWRLVRSLTSMFLVMLVAAVVIARLLDLPPAVEIAIVALALAPIPPLLPKKQAKVGGDASYAVGLVVAASLFAIIWIPLALAVLQEVFGLPLRASLPDLVKIVLVSVLAPLAAGATIGRFAPGLAASIQPTLARLGGLLLLAAVAAILFKLWRPVLGQLSGGTVATLAAFVLVGLLAGQILGGPEPEARSILAMASAFRHPGIAIYLASLNFPDAKAVVPVILLYLLVSAVLTIPYVAWRKRVGAAPPLQA
jgi:BASS family bile acid:Na+ symporter